MKKIKYLLLTSIPLVVFIIWTILVKTIDVQYIDQIGFLGFYQLNTSVNDFVKGLNNQLFKRISDILLYFSIVCVAPVPIIGIIQAIKRKSIFKINPIIYFMLLGYLFVVIMYVVFEIVKINFSPLSTPEELKASYPSTHVFVCISFLAINAYATLHYIRLAKPLSFVVMGLFAALSIGQVICRMFSGHHYLTDIIGGVLLPIFIFAAFYSLFNIYLDNKEQKEEEIAENN